MRTGVQTQGGDLAARQDGRLKAISHIRAGHKQYRVWCTRFIYKAGTSHESVSVATKYARPCPLIASCAQADRWAGGTEKSADSMNRVGPQRPGRARWEARDRSIRTEQSVSSFCKNNTRHGCTAKWRGNEAGKTLNAMHATAL